MAGGIKIITNNRKARHDYHIEETLEAGLELLGTEVKSLREGRANLQDSFCTVKGGEMMMLQSHIAPYHHATHFNHDAQRPRKLLMHAREIGKWDRAAREKGYTIIPLKLYFKNGYAKVEIGLARGKRLYDKRADIAERDTQRRLERIKRGGTDE